MSRLATLALVTSLVAGSWVGLGRPNAAQARVMAEQLAARARTPSGAAQRPKANVPIPEVATRPAEPATPGVDPSLLPDPTPWPRLNPAVSTRRAWLLAEGPHHPEGDGRRLVTFTFDDGPFPETTPVFLKVLARHNVKGAFFWIGHYLDGDADRAKRTREVARDVVAEGHLVGNHTHDHMRLTTLQRAEVLAQIDDGAMSIERATGKRPALFRPPYGQLDAWTSDRLRERGIELVLWSVEANDMKTEDGQAIMDSIREQLEYAGGGIVLLHDVRWGSADALEKLLTWLDHHRWDPARPDVVGYQVTDLVQYLRATAASPQGAVHVVALGVAAGRAPSFPMKQGRLDQAWAAVEGGAVMISEPFAYRHALSVGDQVPLNTDRGPEAFPVAGVFYDYGSSAGVVVMSRRTYERFWDDRLISSLALDLAPGADAALVMAAVRERGAGRQDIVVRSNRALRDASLLIFDRTFAITGVLRTLTVAVAFIGMLAALMALGLERAREIGVLRTLGLTPRQVWMLVMD
jgi:peptidoglycan/xylan/chitin deacetylase (PgdA/CDA1 family)